MRISIDLPADLLLEAEKLAAELRVPLARVLEECLRYRLAEHRSGVGGASVLLPLFTEPEVVPGVDLDDTSGLWELA